MPEMWPKKGHCDQGWPPSIAKIFVNPLNALSSLSLHLGSQSYQQNNSVKKAGLENS